MIGNQGMKDKDIDYDIATQCLFFLCKKKLNYTPYILRTALHTPYLVTVLVVSSNLGS